MFLIQDLQMFVALMVSGGIAIRLSQDIYKTREKRKTRKELLKLNWEISNVVNLIENKFSQRQHTLKSEGKNR